RPTVDLPLPLSPTIARVSARPSANETPSTAWTRARAPNQPARRTASCLTRSFTSRTGSGDAIGHGGRGRRVGVPAGRRVARLERHLGRHLAHAARVRQRTARREGA